MDFYQRFKGRISNLNKNGIEKSCLNAPVVKSGISPIKTSATSIISSTPRLSGIDNHSVQDTKEISTERQASNTHTCMTNAQSYQSHLYVSKKIGYRPYNLADYRSIASPQYYELRGLGPSIGSEDWQRKLEQLNRRKKYAQSIRAQKSQKTPTLLQRKL